MTAPALNSVAWFEFGSDKPEEIQSFYSQLFDWNFTPNHDLPGVNYHAAITPGAPRPGGGIFESDGTFADYAIFYVLVADVADVADTIARTTALGAEVLMEPLTDASGVTFARLRDSTGNHFGIFSAPAPTN
ncbi:glyoxalase [Rhodococcus sp. 06-235-1A]|uniref:VOC family protein n=1 Tax=Rhodococcus sp. 06-235-1A TaxID=2022508 RepID=UPI000B9BB55A|nr:VOC family protein [Rhodococcus sp. 06-235-1A]OZD10385.1 glyoxalase [Rhodococcus sp. 06-235-1A]